MSLVDTVWYANFGNGTSTGYYAVTQFAVSTAYTAGQMRRQLATPAVGSERVFVCIVAGTSGGSEPAWTLTRGAKTVSGTATFQECTGQAALNGDNTNVATWAEVKAATPAVLGQIIKRSNNASYQICTTAGAMSASEPAFSDTAGTTTTDTTAVWTSLGPVSNFTVGGAAPFARLTQACASTWCAAGNTVYVGSNHAETQVAAINIVTVGNTAGAVVRVLCHNSAGSYPPASGDLMTGAVVATSSSGSVTITIGGSLYVYGIVFRASATMTLTASGAASNQTWQYYENCSFQTTSGTSTSIVLGAATGVTNIIFNNCTVRFAHASQYIYVLQTGPFRWQNTGQVLASGSTVPTSLFNWAGGFHNINVTLEALDLSQITGALFTFPALATAIPMGTILVKDCKLNATTTVATPLSTGCTVQLVRCDA